MSGLQKLFAELGRSGCMQCSNCSATWVYDPSGEDGYKDVQKLWRAHHCKNWITDLDSDHQKKCSMCHRAVKDDYVIQDKSYYHMGCYEKLPRKIKKLLKSVRK